MFSKVISYFSDCPEAPENMSKMKCVRRISINEEFEVCPNNPIPDVPATGARIKVKDWLYNINTLTLLFHVPYIHPCFKQGKFKVLYSYFELK